MNTGNCLWCERDMWENTICWFHLWVGSFDRSTDAACTHFSAGIFSCWILVCTSSLIYIRPNAVWRGTAFMLESVSQDDWLNFFPFYTVCPLCLLHLPIGLSLPARLKFSANLYHLHSNLTLHFEVSPFPPGLCAYTCVCIHAFSVPTCVRQTEKRCGRLLGGVRQWSPLHPAVLQISPGFLGHTLSASTTHTHAHTHRPGCIHSIALCHGLYIMSLHVWVFISVFLTSSCTDYFHFSPAVSFLPHWCTSLSSLWQLTLCRLNAQVTDNTQPSISTTWVIKHQIHRYRIQGVCFIFIITILLMCGLLWVNSTAGTADRREETSFLKSHTSQHRSHICRVGEFVTGTLRPWLYVCSSCSADWIHHSGTFCFPPSPCVLSVPDSHQFDCFCSWLSCWSSMPMANKCVFLAEQRWFTNKQTNKQTNIFSLISPGV